MNNNILRLNEIASKDSRLVIGLMSGTSFDGLDVALCKISGSGRETAVEVLHFITKDYDATFKGDLKSVFAKKMVDLEKVVLLNEYIGSYHGELVLQCLNEWNVRAQDIDAIASHGQTIFHAPKRLHVQEKYGNGTLQIGDGDHIAVKTGIITLSDFRQKHIAAGGEGAPLALYGDYLMFSSPSENRIMLNVGGIANFTYLPAGDSSGCFSTDVGPGNTLMDQFVQKYYPGKYYDKDGEIASTGKVDEALLKALMADAFFHQPVPKTTGPELFSLNYLNDAITKSGSINVDNANVMATLAKFTAEAIILAIEKIDGIKNFQIYISGGGMYNPIVNAYIEAHFKIKLRSTEELGIHPDAKEAVLFAVLANETLSGGKTDFSGSGAPSVTMGKISFPS